jgi:hypothetical protein
MDNLDLRFLQIHLDIHMSEFIDGIGAQFDPEEFAGTLEKAQVNLPPKVISQISSQKGVSRLW